MLPILVDVMRYFVDFLIIYTIFDGIGFEPFVQDISLSNFLSDVSTVQVLHGLVNTGHYPSGSSVMSIYVRIYPINFPLSLLLLR